MPSAKPPIEGWAVRCSSACTSHRVRRKACKKEHNAAYYAKRKAFPSTSITVTFDP